MFGLLKLHELAAQRGEGLLPELLELLARASSPDDAHRGEDRASPDNVTPLRPRDAPPPDVETDVIGGDRAA